MSKKISSYAVILCLIFNFISCKDDASNDEANLKNKSEGELFLKQNKTKDGIKVTNSGLQYEVLVEGTGITPNANSSVTVNYTGTLINGNVFDSSRAKPISFRLNQVIRGWTEGLQLMKEGSKYRFFIPYDLAYGERGAGGSIKPFSALIFEVELIKVN